MLTEKQKQFYEFILKSSQTLKDFPNINYLKINSPYKSYNTIYKYLEQLQKKGYIKYDKDKKTITYLKDTIRKDLTIDIPILNENKFVTISNKYLKNNNYIAFLVHNNRLNSSMIKNKDILIFEKSQANLNNKIVLALLDSKIMPLKYIKKDGFIHLLNDKETYFLTKNENIIGKLVLVIRNTMD